MERLSIGLLDNSPFSRPLPVFALLPPALHVVGWDTQLLMEPIFLWLITSVPSPILLPCILFDQLLVLGQVLPGYTVQIGQWPFPR